MGCNECGNELCVPYKVRNSDTEVLGMMELVDQGETALDLNENEIDALMVLGLMFF
jgi:hypothetical protein